MSGVVVNHWILGNFIIHCHVVNKHLSATRYNYFFCRGGMWAQPQAHNNNTTGPDVCVRGIKTIKAKWNQQSQKGNNIKGLIKVISWTPLVSVFRLSLIPFIIVTLPLLILLKDQSLHLSAPLPHSILHTLTFALADLIHTLRHTHSHTSSTHCPTATSDLRECAGALVCFAFLNASKQENERQKDGSEESTSVCVSGALVSRWIQCHDWRNAKKMLNDC